MKNTQHLSSKKIRVPIGTSDFKNLREGGYYFVDKSLFIREVIEASPQVLLFPRPRRFGKTLNMSMLRYFFEMSSMDNIRLFSSLKISDEDVFAEHRGKYPVIFLTFKDLKHLSWEGVFFHIKNLIRDEFVRHEAVLLSSDVISSSDKRYIGSVLNNEGNIADYGDALRYLSGFLRKCYNQPVVILIDEYDTPIHAGYTYGYYDQVINIMRNLLSGGLKDNSNLFKGVLTGILRVAKESVFSGLNNPGVYTLLEPEFNTAFGFTDEETKRLLSDFDISDRYDQVSHWYNGYLFGGEVIYNPWSLLNYADSKDRAPRPYWINTASTEIIDRLATREGRELREEIGDLLEGKAITKPVYDNIVMRDLEKQDNLLWSFLLFSGYLKPVEKIDDENYRLRIPNHEVRMIYRNLVKTWFNEKIESGKVEQLLKSLEHGNTEAFEYILSDIVEKVLSTHDTGGLEPEKFYHAFVLGLLVWLESRYEIRSNRESGMGRYDMALIPKDRTKQGIIMEFKKVNIRRKEPPEQTLEQALKQIEDRKYAAELQAAGISNILKIAIAFRGKELWMKTVNAESETPSPRRIHSLSLLGLLGRGLG